MRNPYLSLLATAWKYARQEKRLYLFIYFLFICSNLTFAANPLLYGWFIESLQKDGLEAIRYVWIFALAYIALQLIGWLFHGPARVMERELAFRLSKNFLEELYHQTLHLPTKWHQDNHSGATINRIRKAYEALREFFENGFLYVYAFAKFFMSFAAMLYFSPLFGGIGVLLGIFTIYIIFKFDKPFIKALNESNEKQHVVSATLFDSLSNIITVITLRLEKRMQEGLMQKVKEVFPPFRRQVRINEWKWFVADMMVGMVYVIAAVGYVYQNYEAGQPFAHFGGLVALLGFVNQFTSVFHDIAWQYTQIVQYYAEVQSVKNIQEAFVAHHRPDASISLPAHWRKIEIHHLNFSHQERYSESVKAHSLHDLHMLIEKGKRIAFIGESGSGKSTLLALLRGLYEPENVRVKIDGKEIDNLAVISDTVTLFPQEPEIFENTIAYNITLGLPFSEEEIMQVCEVAHFAEVVGTLPKGLESNIQEKGVNLSGGQKQRLALARGILAAKGSDIVLLDEPTSSVDPKTEVQIYDKLFEEFKGKAILSSLHRLHLLSKFDYVYILQNGRIVDEGSFEYLKIQSPIFQELWKHQEEAQAVAVESEW
ncbi:ABC transporter ATP-binding protein [Thermoflexibacter ruber]|uniref:ABC-type multidrug transport system, ATPase and permease component n=1 Tax=Thermoflexibacter ruber TaxID=1003 RepID=A0A1I2IE78_9BACT|nr:ABC transporter ATP-binding protein [Thermoflexibacter ruber]SFF40702.1 ABC-type multidrug transport system, ATPase and permease component [Thermoflexibacter ruber]